MIRILSLTIYNAGNSDMLYYESFKEKKFGSNDLLQNWRNNLEREYEKIFRMPVKAYVIRRTKPKIEIDMMSVLMNTALVMNQDINKVLTGSRKRALVDVRKTACMILIDADYGPAKIEAQLPFKNRIIYSYREAVENRLATEPGYEKKYKEIREKVMKLSLNGNVG